MDTSEQVALETSSHTKRRRRTVEEKRRIVEETLEAGASVARVARRHAVNANQVFYWRKKYREGRLGKGRSNNLLPVTVSEIPSNKSGQVRCVSSRCSLGAMEIKLPKGQVRITGSVEAEALRIVLECLLA
jgi:transposase